MKKTYSNGEIEILWQPEKCIHSAVCVKGLPAVFRPREVPWIVMTDVDSKTIVEQVSKCPSGALSIHIPDNK